MIVTLDYLILSLVIIILILTIIKFVIPYIETTTLRNKYDNLFSRIRDGIEFLRSQPDGYELIVTNPDKLPGTITQRVDEQGRPYIELEPSNKFYARQLKIYYINVTNLDVNKSIRIDKQVIRFTKIGKEGNVTLIRIS